MLPRRSPIALLILLMLFAAVPLQAAAKKGWTKLELSPDGGGQAAVPAALLQKHGAELIADYGTYSIVYAPKGAFKALQAQAAEAHFRVRERDELDVLRLPGGDVDAREGISGVSAAKLAREYPAGKPGVFVLQLTAAARKEWISELQAAGWTISRYVPNNAYLVIGAPELVGRTRQLPYVQWLDFYHPYQKAAWLQRDGSSRDLVFELPAGAASEAGVEAIRAAAEGAIEVDRGLLDTLVYARMSAAAAQELLRHEMILSAGVSPEGQLADGRQVFTLSPFLNSTQSAPSDPNANYWNWVLSVCPDCASMPATTWKIGVADSGLDNGGQAFGHPDLNGRKFFGAIAYGNGTNGHDLECPSGQLLCDAHRHGTLVSGIAAGNATTGARDSGGYLMGLGGAPTAGIFMTKILSTHIGIQGGRLIDFTSDATNNGVTVQNHSWEQSNPLLAGTYTSLSRLFDIAARDADDERTANRLPLLMTVAAGNDDNGTGMKVSPVGMAKNVLSVGGLENFRPEANVFNCRGTRGDSFRNIMRTSRNGSNLAGYVKPDVMAPASVIVSTQSSIRWSDPTAPYCLTAYEGDVRYNGDSGTSFAAPLGAAASMVVKRYLGATPDATSPALVRAVLVAGARSVRNGEDRSENPAVPVGPVPSQQQGFGRLTLEDILNGAQKPVFFDQAGARTFTAAGQTFCTRLRIRDVTKPVKIALVWTDTPATSGVPNPLVNDLDLEVRRASNTSRLHVGNSLAVFSEANGEESIPHVTGGTLPYDAVNNIEYFRSFMNASEEFNITVKARAINGDTDGNTATFEQDFALVILNADLVSTGVCDAPPTAAFTVTCVDLTCTANATASSDDVGIVSYSYNWGDSTPATTGGAIQSHTYAATNTYNIVLTVTDTIGQTGSTNRSGIACAPLAINAQPQPATVVPGGSATLSVSASGGGTLTYQWYRGNSGDTSSPVIGATGATLNTGALSVSTRFWVRVTRNCNGSSSIDSQSALVTVACNAAPTITVHPASQTIPGGQSTTLSVTATQAQSYQWYRGLSGDTSNPIAGATASSVTVAPTVTTSYWVRVLNDCGFANSNTATLTVCNKPVIAQQPLATQTIPAGQAATLSVIASGDPTLTYQWYEGASPNTATPIAGATNASYTTPALFTAKQYWVRVSNSCGFVNSQTATVNVTCNREPIITAQPIGGPINQGGSRTLSVSVQADGPVSYQWYTGTSPNTASPIAGATASSITVSPAATTNYWVRVTNACGVTNSNTATVTVCVAPSIAQHPASTTITTGQSATLTVVAGGSGPFSYQWYIGASGNTASPIAGAVNASVVVTPSATTSYWVRVTSTCNGSASVNSNAATVTVVPPNITRRQASYALANSQTSITANWATPTQAGNLLVAVISSDKHDTDTWNWNAPAGWVLAVTYEWNHVKSSIYYLPNNAGGRTSETFTINMARYRDQVLQLLEYSGVALTNPLDKTAFNGDHQNDGFVETGYTANTVQSKELVITSLAVYAQTEFSSPSGGFTEVSDRFISWNLTNAVHEKITTVAGSYGHYAAVGAPEEWVGLVATFKSANPN